ncbi:CoA-binding protein [Pseudoroseicyclus sp. H15]
MRLIQPDDYIRDVLTEAKVIALIGASDKEDRPSHRVMKFLQSRGYRVIPVNPRLAGKELLGEKVYGDVREIEEEVDMIDIFRKSEDVPSVALAAMSHFKTLKSIWMQVGVTSFAAAEVARAKGLKVVQDRCPAIEIPRLLDA